MVEYIPDPRAIYREQIDSAFNLLSVSLVLDLTAATILVVFIYLVWRCRDCHCHTTPAL